MTGLSGLFDLPILLELALWVLAVASTVTVVQRIWVVRRQALAQAAAGAAVRRPSPSRAAAACAAVRLRHG